MKIPLPTREYRGKLGATRLGYILGRLRSGPAGAGCVSAGAEIIVLAQTIRTKVDLVDLAMDHG